MKVIELDPNEIIIGERFRKDIDKEALNNLAESIKQHGQLQPIGVVLKEGKYHLVFGHRRTEACKKLGIKVQAVVLKAEDELRGRVIEFIENAVRQDFAPIEKALAAAELHDHMVKEKGKKWSVAKTAALLGISQRYMFELLGIARNIGAAAETKGVDLRQVDMKTLRRMNRAKRQTQQLQQALVQRTMEGILSTRIVFLQGDCFKQPLPEHYFNLILTDPPYGIDYKRNTNTEAGDLHGTDFADDPEKASEDFITALWKLFDRLASKEEAWVICFCSIEQFLLHRRVAQAFGFEAVYQKPVVWIKASSGIPFNADCLPVSCYEVCVFASRSKKSKMLKPGIPDWVSVPRETGQRIHPTQKPVDLWSHFLTHLAMPHYKLIDPFAGSGTALIAAARANLSEAWGVEENKSTWDLATKFVANSTGLVVETSIKGGEK